MAASTILYQQYSDEELMPLLLSGHRMAFDELYKRYSQKMFSYFFRMLWKDKELAEDFTQDLFVKLIKNAELFVSGRQFSTWIYSIAHNMCKNEYRKQHLRKLHANQLYKEPVSNMISPDIKKFKEAVHQCSNELSEEKKTLYILRFQENLSVPEISSIMNIPQGTIKSRIFYLLKDMKEKLKDFETLPIYP